MNVNQFDFILPSELIAQTPLMQRADSKLLVLDRQSGDISHRHFVDFLELLEPGDLLVLNDTKVLPARLKGVKESTGANIETLLLKRKENAENCWECLVKPAKRAKKGTKITFSQELCAYVEEDLLHGGKILRFEYEGVFEEILAKIGQMPLPPYIKERLEESERYQTVFAKELGSAAAPTAGLHFTPEILKEIENKGVKIAYITLHVGLGTFRPVEAEEIQEHHMHKEFYDLSQKTAELLNQNRQEHRRIFAVGTTVARTLETLGQKFQNNEFSACSGWTDIFIYPPYKFQVISALLTNFHLPKSTLLMLVSAFANREHVLKAYQEAIELKYRFFSFGDAMVIK